MEKYSENEYFSSHNGKSQVYFAIKIVMQKLNIQFENCFGIGKLNHEFDFTKSNTFLIYAPNGTMKTSFAKTMDLISKKDKPSDRVYTSRISKYIVLNEGVDIDPNDILVINTEDNNFDASSKISSFLASKDLKDKYDNIYAALDSVKSEFIKKLKSISQSTDCESEFITTFSANHNTSFFELILDQLDNLKEKYDKIEFKYNDIFDKKGNVKKFLNKHQKILDQYFNDYKTLISKSKFFKESNKSTFGTYQANELLKSIEDNSFFDAGHKFILEDGTEIGDTEQLKQIVQHEIKAILNDEKLKKSFDDVDKAIGSNIELRAFKKVIEKDNLILVGLRDYDAFKKDVWINYLSEIRLESEELIKLYQTKKKELEHIITESKTEFILWRKIIDTFNSRFYVPFRVILVNQEDIILKQETGNLEFDYSDNDSAPVRQQRDSLLSILSKGEQRAYFILQFLFEIEARKLNASKSLLVFDDIADSFDYKNKFAIIEYIKDLHESNDFRLIILTHNFDFYRTVFSRMNLQRDVVYMATKNKQKEITLHKGQYRNNVFEYFLQRYSEPKIFISLIAFMRNLVEYSETDNCTEYIILTKCLHKKEGSNEITANDIFAIYAKKIGTLQGKNIGFGEELLYNLIIQTAEDICSEDELGEIILENKITLAIAIRLKAEDYLISKLPEVDLNKIKSHQTQKLYREYCNKYPESGAIDTLAKVNLMTPENIHINAFMYEPLIDMSVHHLVELFKETKSLN